MVQLANGKAEDQPPTHEEVRKYLRKLLASSDFSASERNRRFLTYVVDETLAGRSSRIKAYNIALAAFDRSEDFDPHHDPIVRIEARRLRRSLEHYYLTAGKADRIRIDIPKGSYIAAFTRSDPDQASSPDAQAPQADSDMPTGPRRSPRTSRIAARLLAALLGGASLLLVVTWLSVQQFWNADEAGGAGAPQPRGPKIIVYPFEVTSGTSAHAFVARGLTYDLIASLTRFDDLFVYGPETSFDVGGPSGQHLVAAAIEPDFVLSGSVVSTDMTLRVSAMVTDTRTGQYVWSWSHETPLTPSHLLQVQSDMAERVARAVGQPYGAVFERTATEIWGKPAKDLSSYECVVRFQQYWRTYDVRQYDDLLGCMETTIKTDPSYARAYSCLALLYVDAYRFGYGSKNLGFDPVQRALELADTAVSLEPFSSDGYLALSVARWFAHNVDGSLEAAQQGLELNPHNTNLIGELGIRYTLLARWDESKAMMDKLFAYNPRAPAGYRRANFFNAYMHGDYETALTEAMSAEMPLNLYDYVMRAMVYAQLGDSENAKAAVAEILKFDPKYGDHVVADFRKRNADPSIVRAIADGLTKAGLPSSTTSGTNR
jgi:adenylate cyclase